MENLNTKKYLEETKNQVLQVLDGIEIAPGTQIHTGQVGTTQIPASFPTSGEDVKDEDPDTRPHESGGKPEHPAEFYLSSKPEDMEIG